MPEQPPRFYKNPAIATILSLFLPGLGQLYNGEYGKGFGLLVLDAISVGLISSEDMSTPGIFIAVVVWIIGMVDANNSANRINGQLAQQTGAGNPRVASNPSAGGEYRNCPFCAEPIHKEAIKCRYCGSAVEPDKPANARGSLLQ